MDGSLHFDSKVCYHTCMEGGCHCGAIRYKLTKKPDWLGACYCRDCQKISGAPYIAFAGFRNGGVELLKGEPKNYESSDKVTRSFCSNCSSPFAFIYKDKPDDIYISVTTLDDPTDFGPQQHIWVSRKMPWVCIDDKLPQRAE